MSVFATGTSFSRSKAGASKVLGFSAMDVISLRTSSAVPQRFGGELELQAALGGLVRGG